MHKITSNNDLSNWHKKTGSISRYDEYVNSRVLILYKYPNAFKCTDLVCLLIPSSEPT